jgi:hypothetical protein
MDLRATAIKTSALIWLVLSVTRLVEAQTNLHTIAADGAWTWFNDPRALFHNGRLYVGHVRNGDGLGVLTAYDPVSGAAPVVWNTSWIEGDDHNNAGLLPLGDGRLMAFYARHSVVPNFAYRTSLTTNPATAADWGNERLFNTSGTVTYANPYQLSGEAGRIYNFNRNLNWNPTFTYSDDLGTNWAPPRILIQTGTGGTRPYVKYASDYGSRIDFLYTDGHPQTVANSLYHAYYQNGALYKTDGTLLKTLTNAPLLHDLGERGSVIYQYSAADSSSPDDHIPTGRAWCWEIVHQTNGSPTCVFTVQRDNVTGTDWSDHRIYYYYARWTGVEWQKRFVAHAGRPLYREEEDYAGGICVDPEDPNIIYISSNAAEPFNLLDTTNVTLRANARYELFRGVTTDNGLTFNWTPVTTNSTVDNLRPYVPRNHQGAPALIWFRGVYSAYNSYNCSVVALLTNAVVQRPSVSIVHPSTSVVHLTNHQNQLKLSVAVTDDGQPGPLTVAWTTLSGPTNALFSDATATDTLVRFPRTGTYVLRATASDALSSTEARITAHVGSLNIDGPDISRVLWLKLDEVSGTIAADSSGHLHPATLSGGTTWMPNGGQRAGALAFNGLNATASVSDTSELDNTAAFTLSYWFRADVFPVSNAALVSKREGPTTANAYTTFLDGATRKILVDVNTADNRFFSSTVINTGVWYHVALVYNGSLVPAQRVKLWINGGLDVTANESSAIIPHYFSAFRLANMPAASPTWLNGVIDDVRFYRRALETTEIGALAISNQAPYVVTGTNLVATNGIPTLLNGTVRDDGRGGPLAISWGQVGGPAVLFGDNNSATTLVTFNQAGAYHLRLSATDSAVTVCEDLLIDVRRNPNIFGDWIALAFPGATNEALVSMTADPDADGHANLLEFGFALDPAQAEASPFTIQLAPNGSVHLTYRQRLDVTRLRYTLLASSDLQSWQRADSLFTLETVDRVPGEFHETITVKLTNGSPQHSFFRVEVEYLAP